jgi:hypothetical protein
MGQSLIRVANLATWVMGRLYGLFFMALGTLFLFWGGRGALAFLSGVRAAWSDPTAIAIGLVVAPLSFWIGVHLLRGGLPRKGLFSGIVSPELQNVLDAAMKLERTDPGAARELLDSYFMRQAADTERRRTELRSRAPHDRQAALELLRDLQAELSDNAAIRKDIEAHASLERRMEFLKDIDSQDDSLKAELSDLERTLARLEPR